MTGHSQVLGRQNVNEYRGLYRVMTSILAILAAYFFLYWIAISCKLGHCLEEKSTQEKHWKCHRLRKHNSYKQLCRWCTCSISLNSQWKWNQLRLAKIAPKKKGCQEKAESLVLFFYSYIYFKVLIYCKIMERVCFCDLFFFFFIRDVVFSFRLIGFWCWCAQL